MFRSFANQSGRFKFTAAECITVTLQHSTAQHEQHLFVVALVNARRNAAQSVPHDTIAFAFAFAFALALAENWKVSSAPRATIPSPRYCSVTGVEIA